MKDGYALLKLLLKEIVYNEDNHIDKQYDAKKQHIW
jgi:hypothetical protein